MPRRVERLICHNHTQRIVRAARDEYLGIWREAETGRWEVVSCQYRQQRLEAALVAVLHSFECISPEYYLRQTG